MLRWNKRKDQFFYDLWSTGQLKVTKSGRVWNLLTGKELGHPDAEGYTRVSWCWTSGKIHSIGVHRLVWLVHGDEKPSRSKFVVHHKNEKRGDNRIRNLALVTPAENTRLSSANLGSAGEANGNAKLRDKDVVRLRTKFAAGKIGVREISNAHGLSLTCVTLMLRGKTYASLGGPVQDRLPRPQAAGNTLIDKIRNLRSNGGTSYSISRELGVARNTVMKYW